MQERTRASALQARIEARIERSDDIAASALIGAPELLELFDADGVIVRLDGASRRSPQTPADDGVAAALAVALGARAERDVAATNAAAELLGADIRGNVPAGALYIRLAREGRAYLLLVRGGDHENVWSEADLAAARTLGERIRARLQQRSQALTHADLYLDSRNAQNAALLQLHDDVAAALPSRPAVLGVLLAFMQRQTRADGSAIETLTATEVLCEAGVGLFAACSGSRRPRDGTLSSASAQRNAALLCADSDRDLEPAERKVCRRLGVASLAVVPILMPDGATVVLKVVAARRHAFNEEDIQTLKLAATNLTTALRAAAEFAALAVAEREQRAYAQQLRALQTIATATTGNREDQIDAALRLGLEQLDLECAFLGAIDAAAGMLVIERCMSRSGTPLAPSGMRVPLAHTVVGIVAEKGVQIVLDVASLAHAPVLPDRGSYIGVPLFADGVNFGVVGFASRAVRREPFSEANVEFIALTGELIAAAVERSRQREALIAGERRYRALTEAIPEMVWVVDAAHRFEYVNERWTAYTGLSFEQSRALGCAAVYDSAGLATVDDKRSMLPPTEFQCEIRLRRHDGVYRWHFLRSVPFRDSASEWLVTATDIEERKSAEALLTGVHDAALAATEAKSRFLATMSHEIRTPMNAVIGMTELLLLTALSEEQREYLEIVRNSGQSLLRVLNDILDYSKIEAGKLELESVHFDLQGQIESVVELLRAQYQIKGVRLNTRIRRDVPAAVCGDPGRLRQILLNLVGNALKFTPEGGDVHIDIRALPAQNGAVPICFSVEDTGIGIPPDVVARLFQPFSQGDESTTRKYGGTGLGLSICAQLVALMKGTIGVESLPGAGSTFTFTIPLRAVKATSRATDARKRGPAARHKPVVMRAEKILLVEDNEINTFLALKQLQRIGFIVSAVNNGRQAVDAVDRERFDLVFMDCHMPEMDGFAATREIRRRESESGSSRLPIVAITADARTEDHQNCLRAGMDDYVSKPTSLESLRAVLDRWLPSPDRRQNSRTGAIRPAMPATLRLAKLLELFGGDRAAVLTLLTAAAGAIKADFARIENCAATGELAAVAEAAHRLKGTSASIHSPRLGEVSVAVEHAALHGDIPDSLLAELRDTVESLIADVEKHG